MRISKRLPPLTAQRERRLRARLPLTLLSVRTGVALSALSEYERGKRVLADADRRRVEREIEKELARQRVAEAERAVDGPFSEEASLRLDRAILDLEVLREKEET